MTSTYVVDVMAIFKSTAITQPCWICAKVTVDHPRRLTGSSGLPRKFRLNQIHSSRDVAILSFDVLA